MRRPAHFDRGIYRILAFPLIYGLLQRLVTSDRIRRKTLGRYQIDFGGKRILDVGCGPGLMVPVLPDDSIYVGIDFNLAYVEEARRRFPGKEFIVGEATQLSRILGDKRSFDVILLFAILHHIEDEEAQELLRQAGGLLDRDGCLLTLDPVFTEGQHPVARWIISRDRGARVRYPDGYKRLLQTAFREVESSVETDLLNVPYSHFLSKCRSPITPSR